MQFGNNSIKFAGKKMADALASKSINHSLSAVKEQVNRVLSDDADISSPYKSIMENKRIIENKRKKGTEFVNESLKFLTFNAIYPVYEECCGYELNDPKFSTIKKNVVMNFIESNGCTNILNAMKKSKTFSFVELADIVELAHNLIVEDNKEEINPKKIDAADPTISPELKDTFIDTINDKKDSGDIEDVSKLVKTYVSSGLEDFIISNIQDKKELETIITDVEDKVDTIKAATTTEESAFIESRLRTAKQKINKVVKNRKVKLFEQMVRHLSKKAIVENVEFLQEGTRLNMQNIVTTCEAMYTMMVLSEALGIKVDDNIQEMYK